MVIREKEIKLAGDKKKLRVKLEKIKGLFIVSYGRETYYKSPNELFAVKKFNEI